MQDVVFGPQEILNNEPRNASEMVGYKYGLQVDRRHWLCLKPRSPTLQADSLLAEPQGKPKNAGVGSLSQQILQTQESNWGFLHCRWILDQLSYQGSPLNHQELFNKHVFLVLPRSGDVT